MSEPLLALWSHLTAIAITRLLINRNGGTPFLGYVYLRTELCPSVTSFLTKGSFMKKWKVLLAIGCSLIVAACGGGGNRSSAEICVEFNSAIDRNIMEIALSENEGVMSDKSAVQQGARLAQINNRLSTITVNILLLAQNKCQPRQKPIDPSIYSSQASSCNRARLDQRSETYGSDEGKKTTAKAKVTSVCDFKAWDLQTPK